MNVVDKEAQVRLCTELTNIMRSPMHGVQLVCTLCIGAVFSKGNNKGNLSLDGYEVVVLGGTIKTVHAARGHGGRSAAERIIL